MLIPPVVSIVPKRVLVRAPPVIELESRWSWALLFTFTAPPVTTAVDKTNLESLFASMVPAVLVYAPAERRSWLVPLERIVPVLVTPPGPLGSTIISIAWLATTVPWLTSPMLLLPILPAPWIVLSTFVKMSVFADPLILLSLSFPRVTVPPPDKATLPSIRKVVLPVPLICMSPLFIVSPASFSVWVFWIRTVPLLSRPSTVLVPPVVSIVPKMVLVRAPPVIELVPRWSWALSFTFTAPPVTTTVDKTNLESLFASMVPVLV